MGNGFVSFFLWYSHIITVHFIIVYQEENSLQVQLISEQKNDNIKKRSGSTAQTRHGNQHI